MKKIIAILLVLVVGFAAFAAVGDATLTLNSTVAGQLYHGFTSSTYTTGAALKTAFTTGGEDGDESLTVDFADDAAQDVGYYNFYTTGNFTATVDLTLSPLSYSDGTSTYYVPYTLGYTAANDGASGAGSIAFAAGTKSFASAAVSTTAIADVTVDDIFTANGAGLRWRSIGLTVDFDATDIDEFGLPETASGQSFTGTIIAAVTAE
ncbi:MAG: hypothetical protein PQJ47_05385 [Sphaerochaetaceae bacterium]|nr:hypothetical protein [Sphaerochaetaceae bacterium]